MNTHETPQQEVDRLSDELSASRERFNRVIGASPATEDRATAQPWYGRMDGLIVSQVGNVRFVLRIERHGDASTLDEEDRACMDLVITAVNSYTASQKRIEALEAALQEIAIGHHSDTCSYVLVATTPCNCPVSIAGTALAKYQEVKP